MRREFSRERLRQIAGWVAVVGGCAVVELGVLKVLTGVLLWDAKLASAVAAELLIIGKFVLSDRLVFGFPRPSFGRLARYQGASAGSFVISWVVLNGSLMLLRVPIEVAFVLGSGVAFCWSFVSNFFWVWARKHPTPVTQPALVELAAAE